MFIPELETCGRLSSAKRRQVSKPRGCPASANDYLGASLPTTAYKKPHSKPSKVSNAFNQETEAEEGEFKGSKSA